MKATQNALRSVTFGLLTHFNENGLNSTLMSTPNGTLITKKCASSSNHVWATPA
jgi:hypothetical protein